MLVFPLRVRGSTATRSRNGATPLTWIPLILQKSNEIMYLRRKQDYLSCVIICTFNIYNYFFYLRNANFLFSGWRVRLNTILTSKILKIPVQINKHIYIYVIPNYTQAHTYTYTNVHIHLLHSLIRTCAYENRSETESRRRIKTHADPVCALVIVISCQCWRKIWLPHI